MTTLFTTSLVPDTVQKRELSEVDPFENLFHNLKFKGFTGTVNKQENAMSEKSKHNR